MTTATKTPYPLDRANRSNELVQRDRQIHRERRHGATVEELSGRYHLTPAYIDKVLKHVDTWGMFS